MNLLFPIVPKSRLVRRGLQLASRLMVFLTVVVSLVSFHGCVDEEEFANTPTGNFEALWKIMDEHYCFFAEKRSQIGVDWNEVKARYAPQLVDGMNDDKLFEVLGNMLGELKDGHVNLYSSFDVARNWSWHENYPRNFSDSLLRKYLGTDYRIASGLRYRILDDNVGYIYCGTFANDFGAGNLDHVFRYLLPCRALIVDVRNNSGGMITSADKLAARFTDKELLVGYMRHKTGRGHDDFSPMTEQRLKPSSGLRWHKPVVVLTNRQVYSAANEFVKYMQCCPQVTVVGDFTGGGAGMPFTSELPNGWGVRFSACPMYDRNQVSTEAGMAPDHLVQLLPADEQKGEDTIIEYARRLLRDNARMNPQGRLER